MKTILDPSYNSLFTSSFFIEIFKKFSSPRSFISNKVASAHQNVLKKYFAKRGFRRGLLLFCLTTLIITNITGNAMAAVSVEEYTYQVESKNSQYKASQEGEQGYKLKSGEATLKYLPRFFVEAQSIDDKRKTNAPVFQGNRTITENISSGISLLSKFGTEGRIYYSQSRSSIKGVNPSFFPMSTFYYNGWNAELTQHLWKDGFGGKNNALAKSNFASALASLYENKFKQKATILEARAKFWQLASTIEAVENFKQSVDIAQKTYDYLLNKVKLGLGERSDLIKIEAYLVSRKYDLENAMLNYKSQLIEFNKFRGWDTADDVSDLILPNAAYISALNLPKIDFNREDIKAKEQQMIASNETYKASMQDLKPTLDLTIAGSITGRSATYNTTMTEANNGVYPYSSVMLNFNVPIEFWKVGKVVEGYKKMQQSNKLSYNQTIKDSAAELNKLQTQFEQNKHLLSLMDEVVSINQKKAEEERRRYKIGKSDLYQLCLIEQEYLNAKNTFIALRQNVLMLYDQILTYKNE